MRPDDVNRLLRQQPFQPFRIYLSNGRTYEVRHPDLAMVGRTTMLLGIPAPDLPPSTYDHYETIALMHINNLEPLPPAPTAGGNGPVPA